MKKAAELEIVYIDTGDLIPYARNSRTHSEEQVKQIAASIKEFGFTNPILTDGENGVLAGHGRLQAAQKLGLEQVPTIDLAHLSEAQKRAYVIADNRIALNAGWDMEVLAVELDDLGTEGFDLSMLGFEFAELAELIGDPGSGGTEKGDGKEGDGLGDIYTQKIEPPVYEPKGDKPDVADLFSDTKTKELLAEINAADIPEEVAGFLRLAAERHTVFNFRNIAEYYAHADAETQDLMERSALVIIDFNKAIENGYVRLSEHLAGLVAEEKANEV